MSTDKFLKDGLKNDLNISTVGGAPAQRVVNNILAKYKPLRHYIHRVEGHTGSVDVVCLSRDGKVLASGGSHKICIWDVETGSVLHVIKNIIQGVTKRITALIMADDCQSLIVGGFDNFIRIYNIKSGQLVRVLSDNNYKYKSGHTTGLFLQDQFLVSVNSNHFIRLWSISNGEMIKSFDFDGYEAFYSITMSYDQRIMFVGGARNIYIFDLNNGGLIKRMESNDGGLCIALSNDGKTLAWNSVKQTIRVWNHETDAEYKVLSGHTQKIESICFSPDGRYLLSASLDQNIRIWDYQHEKCLQVIKCHFLDANSIYFGVDGQTIVSVGSGSSIRLWNLESRDCFKVLESQSSEINSICLAPNNNTLVSGSYGHIRVHSLENGKLINDIKTDNIGNGSPLLVSRGMKYIITGSAGSTVSIYNGQTGKLTKKLVGHSEPVTCLGLSHNEKVLVSGSFDNTVRVWDFNSFRCCSILTNHDRGVTSLCLDRNGRYLASASSNKIIICDLGNGGRIIDEMDGHYFSVYTVVMDPGATLLFSGGGDWKIIIWDLALGQIIHELEGHSDAVRALALSHDGRTLISASEDQTIRIWDLESKECLSILEGHSGQISSLCLSQDDKILFSAGQDHIVRIWDFKSGTLLALLHNVNQGFIWTTPPETGVASGWIWTDQGDLVNIIECDQKNNANPKLVINDEAINYYIKSVNSQKKVMTRINDYRRYEQDLAQHMQITHDSAASGSTKILSLPMPKDKS